MKTLDVIQGTEEWKQARLGIPTASQAARLITPKTLKPSSGRGAYLAELLAEWSLGHPLDAFASEWMERGTAQEPEAINWYAFEHATEVERVGFCLGEGFGCSPDGLVGEDGGVEIKCPSIQKHVGYWLTDGASLYDDYKAQVQATLWVTGREWWDLISYNPDFPSVVVRIKPDAKFSEAFGPIVAEFAEALEHAKEKYRKVRPVAESTNGTADTPFHVDLEAVK